MISNNFKNVMIIEMRGERSIVFINQKHQRVRWERQQPRTELV